MPAHNVSTDAVAVVDRVRVPLTAWQLQELPICDDKAVYHRLQLQHPSSMLLHQIGLRHAPHKLLVGCSGGVHLGLCVGAGLGSRACTGSCWKVDWQRSGWAVPASTMTSRDLWLTMGDTARWRLRLTPLRCFALARNLPLRQR